MASWRVQGVPSSWGTLLYLCRVLRPRQDRHTRPYGVPTRPPGCPRRRLPRVEISRLNSTALALAVYASQWSLLAPTQDSLPAAGQALPGGIGLPTRLLRKVSDRCHPPFPSFLGARTLYTNATLELLYGKNRGGARNRLTVAPGVRGRIRHGTKLVPTTVA